MATAYGGQLLASAAVASAVPPGTAAGWAAPALAGPQPLLGIEEPVELVEVLFLDQASTG
jgi:class 3 adenylate cyclase